MEESLIQSELSTKQEVSDTLNKVNTKFKSERKRIEDNFSSIESNWRIWTTLQWKQGKDLENKRNT
jgi:hypothetical protein